MTESFVAATYATGFVLSVVTGGYVLGKHGLSLSDDWWLAVMVALAWPLAFVALVLYQPMRLAHYLGTRSARAGKGGGK